MQEAAIQVWQYISSEFKHTLVEAMHSTDPQEQSNIPVWMSQMWNSDGLWEHPYHRLTLRLDKWEAKKNPSAYDKAYQQRTPSQPLPVNVFCW